MQHLTTGRHRRPHRSRRDRVIAFLSTLVATTLSVLFVPGTAGRREPAPVPLPPVRSLPAKGNGTREGQVHAAFAPAGPDPDDVAGALIRPYMAGIALPRPRTPEPDPQPDEFADLTARIRDYLALCT